MRVNVDFQWSLIVNCKCHYQLGIDHHDVLFGSVGENYVYVSESELSRPKLDETIGYFYSYCVVCQTQLIFADELITKELAGFVKSRKVINEQFK